MLESLIDMLTLKPEEDGEEEMDTQVRDKIVPYKSENNKRSSSENRSQAKTIIILKPKKIDDARSVIDHLIEGYSVTVDLVQCKGSDKQRILDMIAGYCYSTDCNMEGVNKDIFIISHTNIEVTEQK